MKSGAIVDSGPLIALFDAGDQHHDRAVRWFQQQRYVGHTTVAVITKVSYMLRFELEAQLDFLRWMRGGALNLVQLNVADFDGAIEVMEKYADLPSDFTDATLVTIADRLGIQTVASFDADFRVYRYRQRYAFKTPLLDAD